MNITAEVADPDVPVANLLLEVPREDTSIPFKENLAFCEGSLESI
jgi:hypothetical protein